MHSVRLVCFMLGVWLAGGLFMAWVATQNFRGVDRLLQDSTSPAARLEFKTLDDEKASGSGATRMLLRYVVSEQNRFYFESWEITQIVIGTLLFFFLLFGTREDKYSLATVLLMLLLVATQRFFLTPEIVTRGRMLDFVAADAETGARARFWLFHNLYSGVELVKWAAAGILVAKLVLGSRRGRSGSDVRKQLDLIDKANHRHVDR